MKLSLSRTLVKELWPLGPHSDSKESRKEYLAVKAVAVRKRIIMHKFKGEPKDCSIIMSLE
jgi:hypothetical protein